ncbi:filamentous hemagglutinin N-terminal domain-containing protein [Thermosynechococcus sp. B0]|uniref:filamentous hemagglutinin N-terminal domain-containing protein n=1 Tax=Thermosynechococcus sp. B0 TaxID=2937284 RepID=UPI00257787E4|nr:filamentous hemagglutinin N-terminal domain-containing protein [Thermosynechococcus sp. B0]WJI24540.1 filamentous hemagglutinin N-terminal domain-containing protein [Thermosynechococcus sp. B0]
MKKIFSVFLNGITLTLSSIFLTSLSPRIAEALPQNPTVSEGQVSFQQSTPHQLHILQSSHKAIINWEGFSIGANEGVFFVQPGATAAALNRVTGLTPSSIAGQLNANGRIFLINPNGIVFLPSAQVNVGSLIASTLDIKDQDFLQDNFRFYNLSNRPPAAITNQGRITAQEGGVVSLIAPAVQNTGFISARLGQVALVSGTGVTLDFTGDGLLSVRVDSDLSQQVTDVYGRPLSSLIDQQGHISAGHVILSASAAQRIMDRVMNVDGIIEARAVENRQGRIILAGGPTGEVNISGRLDADGIYGGQITVTGQDIHLQNTAHLSANGNLGGGQIFIGGSPQGQGPLPNARNTFIDAGARLEANALTQGNGGTVIAWADEATHFHGHISARGGSLSGNGGFAEVSARNNLYVTGFADLRAPNGSFGTLLLDPGSITIQNGPSSGPNIFGDADIVSQLGGGNLTITTASAGSGLETITVETGTNITWSGNTTLTLQAGRNIVIEPGVTIQNTGDGGITLKANISGGTSGNFKGIFIEGTAAQPTLLATNSGNITLTGRGGTSGNNNYGIQLTGYATLQSNSGQITLDGTGGTGGSNNYGVYLSRGARIGNNTGNISISGTAPGGSGQNNDGVFITTTPRNNDNPNTLPPPSQRRQTQITNQDGNITITGYANGSSATDDGIAHWNALVRTTGSGNITYEGYSGTGSGNASKDGLELQRHSIDNFSAEISATGSGHITLRGVLRGGHSGDNAIKFGEGSSSNNHFIVTSNTGNICLIGEHTGTASSAITQNWMSIRTAGATPTIQSTNGGNIILVGDRLDLSSNTTLGSSGILVIQPFTPGRDIDIAGTAPDTTHLALSSTEFGLTNGFSHVIFGHENGTGTVTINSPITRNQHLTLRGGNIQLNSPINLGGNTLALFSNGGSVTQTSPFTASGLILGGSGNFILNQPLNNVNTIATASSTGAITYQDQNALTVGNLSIPFVTTYPNCCTASTTTLTANGITTNNADVILRTGGLLTLAASSNLGSGNLTLMSNGGVTQTATGSITAAGLGLQGSGTFDLNNASNDVDTLAANVTGGVSFKDSDDLTIGGPVTSTVGSDTATTAAGLTTTNNDAIIESGNTLTLAASSNLGSGNLTLMSNGGVSQTATGSITATGLGLQGSGTFDLNNASNDVDTLAANVTGGVSFKDSDDLTIGGPVTSTVGSDTATTAAGLTTTNNDAIIESGNTLTLAASSNLGSGNLTLMSNGGVTQTATGSITATGLGLQGSGTFDLNNASNDVDTLAANVTGGVSFKDSDDLTIGGPVTSTVGSDTATTAAGLTTTNNDAIIESGNTLTLAASSNLGSGNLTLMSNGGVTQTATGSITATGLGLQGSGTFDLNNASNDVDTLAANVTGGVSFKDSDDLTIGGPVTSTVGSDTATTAAGLTTTNNDAIIESGNTLTLAASSNLGSGNLTLMSNGGVTQTATGSITATGLGLQGSGTFDLNNASNDVDTLAANVTGGVSFKDSDDLTIGGPVTSTVGSDTATTAAGLTTTNNDAIIESGNTLTLAASSNLGSGNLTLMSNGGVTQTATGSITAAGLGLQGSGTFDLNNASNDVDTLAANVTGGVSFKDSDDLTIGGPVTSTVGSDTATTAAGLTTTNNDAIIESGNTLTLAASSNLGSGNLTLISNNGVSQTPTGSITATGLGLQGSGTFDLNNASNDVDTLAANVTGGVSFKDSDDLTIGGPVTSTVGSDTATTAAGLTTTNNDAIIESGNTLTLAASSNLGSGNLTLMSNGGVTQTATGSITATGLGLQGSGTFDLNNASNDVDTLAANVTGGVSFKDSDDLTIGGPVTSTVGSDTATTAAGLTTTNNDAIIESGNTLTLAASSNLGSGNLTLMSNGGVSQTPTGSITAAGLGLQGSGTFDLNNASNDVDTLAANVTGGVSFKDSDDLTIGGPVTSTVGSDTATTAAGLTTTNNDAIIESGNTLILAASSNLGSGNLTLMSNGGVSQTPTGSITAAGLGLQGSGTFDLNNASNDVDTLAANVTGGVSFKDSDDLTIGGPVTSTVGSDTATTAAGLTTTNNDAIIESGNTLTLAASSNLGSGNLTLMSNGGVSQTPTGSITAAGLGLQGSGTFDLNNASNDVDTLAANVTGGVSFKDSDDLTIGGPVTSTVGSDTATTAAGLTTTNNDAIIESGNTLTLAASSNLGSGNLTLMSNGGVSQTPTGSITAAGLGLQGSGTFDLNNASNDVDTLAANVTGGVSFKDSDDLTIGGPVTSTVGSDTATTAAGLTTTNNDAIIESGNTLTLAASSNLGSGNLTLMSNGGVTQTATGSITATGLGLQGSGTFDLNNASNDVDTLAANVTGGVSFKDSDDLTIGGPVTSTVGSDTATTAAGLTTTNNDAIIESGNTLTLAASSNLGSGNLTLMSNGGVTQTATGSITATGLGLQGSGTFDLNNASNDVDTLAANVTGGVSFKDSDDLTIGGPVTSTVGSDTATTAAGLTTTNNDAIIESGNTLTLAASSNLGSGNLTLMSNGGVTQTATGSITATGLGLQGSGTFDLNNASNDVDTLAANVTGGVSFKDSDDLTIGGPVTSTVGSDTATTAAGLTTTNNDAIIESGNTLTLAASSNLGSGNLTLMSNGGVTQTATGSITATGLGLQGSGTFDLNNASNDVDTLAANVTGGVSFKDSDDLTIGGPVTSTVGSDTATTAAGLTTTNNDAIIESGNTLTLAASSNLGSGNLTLMSNGGVTQTATGSITATGLGLQGSGTFDLNNASNDVDTLAANVTGGVSFKDSDDLTIGGPVTSTVGSDTATTAAGLTTTNNDAIIESGNTLTLAASSNLGSGNLTLMSNGGVTQTATGSITATGLGLQGSGTFDLNNASNDVDTLAANVTGGVSFKDSDDLTIGGPVTSTVGSDTATTAAGLTTTNNDAIIESGNTLTLAASSNLGSGNLTLMSNGGVTQTATGSITATGLGLQGSGTFDLNNASNDVDTLAANVTGGVSFKDSDDLTIGGPVTSTVGSDTATTAAGLTTTNNDAIIESGNTLTLAASSNLGSGNLTLMSNGGVTQTATGSITAAGLGLQGSGTFDLNNASNDVDTLAANVTGGVSFKDSDDLTIGGPVTSTVGSDTATTAAGLTTTNNDAIIESGNTLTLAASSNLGSGNLTLMSNGGVTQTATGSITAAGLGLQGSGTFDLNNASNDVDTLAANVTGGVSFKDSDDLTIGGPVTSTVGSDTATTAAGLTTTNNDAIIESGNTLTLAASSNLGSGNLTLMSNGGVSQTPTGSITAAGLGLQGSGTFDLNNASNDVDTLAANVTGGVSFKDSDDLTIGGPVTSTVGSDTATTAAGLTTTNNDAIIESGNTLTLAASSNLGSGNLTLMSNGGVSQTPTGSITAAGLGLQGSGTFDLNNASNDVDTLAANVTGGVSFKDSDDLTIGGPVTSTVGSDTATTAAGLTTTNNDAIIESGNTLTLAASSNLGSGNLTLMSNGGVTQTATGSITATGLGLQGSGTFDLNNASNDVDTLAANVTGGVSFKDSDDLTIGGPVTSTVGSDTATTAAGLTTTNNDAIIESGNTLTLAASSNLGSGNLTLMSNGGVTQTPTGSITAAGLGLQGSGTFDLNNASNDVDTLAANVTGGVSFKDSDDLTIGGPVTSTVGSDTATTAAGLTTTNNDAIIESGNTLTLAASSNLGSGNLTLMSNGGVTQTATGSITATGLGLQGSGTFDLNNASNDVDTLAANVTGGVSFKDSDDLTIGGPVTSTVGSDTATTAAGLTTTNNDAIIESGNTLTLAASSNLGSGNLTLMSNGGVTQTATGSITATGLGLQGSGTFDLNNAPVAVTLFAAQVNGSLLYNGLNSVNIGTVTSTVGSDIVTTTGLSAPNLPGDGNQPPSGGNQPPSAPNLPGGGNQPPSGGNQPPSAPNLPGDGNQPPSGGNQPLNGDQGASKATLGGQRGGVTIAGTTSASCSSNREGFTEEDQKGKSKSRLVLINSQQTAVDPLTQLTVYENEEWTDEGQCVNLELETDSLQ